MDLISLALDAILQELTRTSLETDSRKTTSYQFSIRQSAAILKICIYNPVHGLPQMDYVKWTTKWPNNDGLPRNKYHWNEECDKHAAMCRLCPKNRQHLKIFVQK